jgi:hypothetical protein
MLTHKQAITPFQNIVLLDSHQPICITDGYQPNQRVLPLKFLLTLTLLTFLLTSHEQKIDSMEIAYAYTADKHRTGKKTRSYLTGSIRKIYRFPHFQLLTHPAAHI